MDKYKYIKNSSIDSDSCDIYLYGNIGSWDDSDQNTFKHEFLFATQHFTEINLRINSFGGSVLDLFGIVSLIFNKPDHITLNTIIEGVAGSAASVISMAGDKIYIMDYGLIFIHNVVLCGEEYPYNNLDDETKTMLEKFNKSLLKIYMKRTGKTEEEVKEWMNESKWFTAEESLEEGLVDEIIDSPIKETFIVKNSDLNDVELIYNSITQIKKDNSNMKEILNVMNVKDQKEAVETFNNLKNVKDNLEKELTNSKLSLKELENKVSEKDAKLEELENKLSEIEKAEEAKRVQEREDLINEAIESKKIAAEQKEEWLAFAEFDLEKTSNILNNMKPVMKISNMIENKKNVKKDVFTSLSDWKKNSK